MSAPAAPAPAPAAPANSWYRRLGSLSGRTLGILLALVVVVAAATRSGLGSDWSADRRFTLSERLVQLLRDQHDEVEMVGVWGGDEQPAVEAIDALLTRMGEVNPKVTYRTIDPVLQKPIIEQFNKRHGATAQNLTIYLCRGDRIFAIPVNPATRYQLQRQVGGALLTLGDPNPPLAVVLQGHGELRAGGGFENGGDQLLHSLALAGFQIQPRTATTPGRPPAESVLVIAGPTSPLGIDEVKLLDEHLQDGGSALVLADDRAPEDLSTCLARHGVFLGPLPDTLPDPRLAAPNPGRILVSLVNFTKGKEASLSNHNLVVATDQMGNQEITAGLKSSGQSLLSPWTSPVYAISPLAFKDEATRTELTSRYAAVGIDQPFAPYPLLVTNEKDAWDKARADPLAVPEDIEKRPRIPLAYAVEYKPQAQSVRSKVGARLVVWGSRQAAANQVLESQQWGNDQFLRAAATWLARRETPTNIPAADLKRFQVLASDTAMTVLLALLVAVIPLVFIGAAMLTWWDRR